MGMQFNALDGPELKKVLIDRVVKELEEQMDLSGDFRGHMTFPWVKYEVDIRVLSYPKEAKEAPAKSVAKADGDVNNVNPGLPEEEKTKIMEKIEGLQEPAVVVDLKVGDVIDTPDEARIKAGLPIPTIAPVAGVTIDKPIPSNKPPVKGGK